MKNKLCFIIPYFGKLPNYFPLFLLSCKYNKDFNWLIFTDDKTRYNYPINVKVIHISFSECQAIIQAKFNFPIALIQPYKLCDLKPMYGYIFEEYITNYKYWGHCDIDTIMGNLGKWLTDEFLEQYDKLFCLGHLTIYRNTVENNRTFMFPYNGKEVYKDVLTTPSIYTFDEVWKDNANICKLFEIYKKKCFTEDLSLNIACAYNKFHRIRFVGRNQSPLLNGYKIENYIKALYLWDKGNLYRYFIQNRQLVHEEFLYMHLQCRKMKMNKDLLEENIDSFKIINDKFTKKDFNEITLKTFPHIKKVGLCWHTQRLLLKKIKRRIKRLLNIENEIR
ncbi:DUF6625 family protein [Bacteroides mediterraneensis]|uniref:DUF6625 family protein n=1 Tax=Bacteroides mediterraneensis TaxID=1841856 RepID=UPI001EF4237C|nr:DUF6625 family protein [Bacteroides mediterraneensis]